MLCFAYVQRFPVWFVTRTVGCGGRDTLDLSRWARSRLAGLVVNQVDSLSYVIPDGLTVDIEHPAATVELFAAVMDVVIAHEPCGGRVLFELTQQASRANRAVFFFRRDGGRSVVCAADRERLEHLADTLSAEVQLVQDAPTSTTAVVSLPSRS